MPTKAEPVVPDDWARARKLYDSVQGSFLGSMPVAVGSTISYTPTLTTGGTALNYNAAQLVSSSKG